MVIVYERIDILMIKKKMILFLLCAIVFAGCSKVSSTDSNKEQLYQSALSYIKDKHYPQAIGILRTLEDYKSSNNLLEQLHYIINGSYISAGFMCMGAVTQDGGVIAVHGYENALSTNDWRNIRHLSGDSYLDAISSDGKIITTYPFTPDDIYESLKSSDSPISTGVYSIYEAADEILNFTDAKALISDYPIGCAIVTSNNTVKAAASTLSDEALKEISTWRDIISVAAFFPDIIGLKADGKVIYLNSQKPELEKKMIDSWENIVAIANGTYSFGLKSDGTVVSSDFSVTYNTRSWNDIIAISASTKTYIGLKRDGTVVAYGDNTYGQQEVSDWTDIVAVSASDNYTLGLKVDGTLVTTKYTGTADIFIPDVTGISNLYVPQIILNE